MGAMSREPEMISPLALTVTVEQSATLRSFAEANELGLAEVVRACIDGWLAERPPRRTLVRPSASCVGAWLEYEYERAAAHLKRKRARDTERQTALVELRARQMAAGGAE